MKNQETITSQMDEIVFEHRNKKYGAYILRKSYNKQLIKALFISASILAASLAYPLVSSYTAKKTGTKVIIESGVEVILGDDVHNVVKPPPPPPPSAEQKDRITFKAPEVVIGEVAENEGLINQDILNEKSENIPVDVEKEPTSIKLPDVLDEPAPKNEYFIVAEEMPFYPGGESERQKFLADNIQYPKTALDMGLQGTVYVQFVVDSKGNITDVKILRGVGGGCDEEAIRVIKMMPQWHPGKQNGKAVRVLYNMSIGFKLQN